MTNIDCAQNYKLAKELTAFLQAKEYSVTQENDQVTVDGKLSNPSLKYSSEILIESSTK